MTTGRGTLIAIDAGNCHCKVAVVKGSTQLFVGSCPSAVFIEGDNIVAGENACLMARKNPRNFIFDLKVMLGRRFDDNQIQAMRKNWPFAITHLKSGEIGVVIEDKDQNTPRTYPVCCLWAHVLHAAVKLANKTLENPSTRVTISVPPDFTSKQRASMISAAERAHLNVEGIFGDLKAIVAGYSFRTSGLEETYTTKHLLLVDIGSRKMTVGFAKRDTTGNFKIEHVSVTNDLGGDMFTDLVMSYALHEFSKTEQIDMRDNLRMMHKLRKACERAKIVLSSAHEAQISVEDSNGDSLEILVTRECFERLIRPLIDKYRETINELIETAEEHHDCSQVSVICVGGSANIPLVQQTLTSYVAMAGKQWKIYKGQHPLEAIALGLLGDIQRIKDPCPVSINCRQMDTDRSCRIFSKGDALPCIKTLQFQLERRCQSHTSFIFYAASGKDDKTTRTLHRYDVSVPKELTFMSIPGCIELKLDLHPDLSLHTCHNFILSGGSGSTCLLEIDDEIHPTHRKDVVNSRCLDSPAATSESENAKSESEGLSNIENAMQTQHTEGKHVIPRNPVANQDDLRVTTNGSMNEDGYESDVKKQCLSKPETRTSDAARSEEKGTRK